MEYTHPIMTKVQLSLTDQEASILTGYGSRFGYSLPKTIRFVISKVTEEALKEGIVPVFKMSERTEQAGLQALQEYREGKAIPVDDVDEFFKAP